MKSIKLLFIFCLFTSFLFATTNENNSETNVRNLPLKGFVENKGQFTDTNGVKLENVFYKLESSGINLWVTNKGLVYQFCNSKIKTPSPNDPIDLPKEEQIFWHRVDMALKDVQIKKQNITALGKIDNGKLDYYIGGQQVGIFDVKAYSKLKIKNIYPNIDWLLYLTNDGFLKQDFIVHPSANPENIKLIYEGSGQISISDQQIKFKNELGEVNEGNLYCYQNFFENNVSARYIAKENSKHLHHVGKKYAKGSSFFSKEVNIEVGQYNKNEALIIDPTIYWGTMFGGSLNDGFTDIDTDSEGNIFAAGNSFSTDFPLLNSGTYYYGTNSSGGKIAIVKFDKHGKLLWSTFYGGASGSGAYQSAYGIEVDKNDNVWIVGYTQTTNFPTQNAGGNSFYNPSYTGLLGSRNSIILKFDNLGNRIMATYFNAGAAQDVKEDANGNIYIVGETWDTPTLNNGTYYQGTLVGYVDAYISKFDNNGALLWATYFGGSNYDNGGALDIDKNGNVFVTGYTESSNFPTFDPGGNTYFQGSNTGSEDLFISKFDSIGNLLWSSYFGGSLAELTPALIVDQNNDIWVSGVTYSNDLPTLNSGGFFQASNNGFSDCFLAKFNNLGENISSTYIGGNKNEYHDTPNSLAIDACNNLYFAFETRSYSLGLLNPPGNCHYYDNNNSDSITEDIFLMEFSSDGNIKWGTLFGDDTNNDDRFSLRIDKSNNLYFCGILRNYSLSAASSIPIINPGFSAYIDSTPNGAGDVYISKFVQSLNYSRTVSIPSSCQACDGSISVNIDCGFPPYSYWCSNGVTITDTTLNSVTFNNLCTGRYQVAISGECGRTDTIAITVAGPFTATVGNDSVSICNGDSIFLANNYQKIAGFYNDTLFSAGANGCDSIFQTELTIRNVSLTPESFQICQGDSILIGSQYQYSQGTYRDTLIGAATNGCDSIREINLSILQISNFNDFDTICQGTSVFIGGAYQSTTGTYYDTIISGGQNGCDSLFITNLTVTPVDTFVNYATLTTLQVNAAGGSIQWVLCPSMAPIIGDTSSTFTPTVSGNYAVIVNQNGCVDTSSCYYVYIVGIDEESSDLGNHISISPNPGNGNIIVSSSKELKDLNMQILDVNSKLLYEQKITKTENTINLSHMSKGVYFVIFTQGDNRFTKKYIKH